MFGDAKYDPIGNLMSFQKISWNCICTVVNEALVSKAKKIVIKFNRSLSFVSVEDDGQCFDQTKFKFLKNREILLTNLKNIYKTLELVYECERIKISRKFELGDEKKTMLDIVNGEKIEKTIVKMDNIIIESANEMNFSTLLSYILYFLNEMIHLNVGVDFEVFVDDEKYSGTNSKAVFKRFDFFELYPVCFCQEDFRVYGFISLSKNISHQSFTINDLEMIQSNIIVCFNKILESILSEEKSKLPMCQCWVHDDTNCDQLVYALNIECPNVIVESEEREELTFTDDHFFNHLWNSIFSFLSEIHRRHEFSGSDTRFDKVDSFPIQEKTFTFSTNFNNFSRAKGKNCFSNIPLDMLAVNKCTREQLDHSLFDKAFVDIEQQTEEIIRRFSSQGISFTKDFFKLIQVVGQVDNKFIASIYHDAREDKPYIILFDQHAMDERIQLESMLKGVLDQEGNIYSTRLEKPIIFQLTSDDLQKLRPMTSRLKKIGLSFIAEHNSIVIQTIPTLLNERLYTNERKKVEDVIFDVIKNEIEFFIVNDCVSSTFPIHYHNLLCQDACKRSIKFGTKLKRNQMERLFKNLAQCSVPFQCAHGRPILTVLCQYRKDEFKVPVPNFKSILE